MSYEKALADFGKRIKELRTTRGLTQQQMGEEPFGTPLTTYQDVEAGRRNLTFQTIYNISRKLETSLEELFKKQ